MPPETCHATTAGNGVQRAAADVERSWAKYAMRIWRHSIPATASRAESGRDPSRASVPLLGRAACVRRPLAAVSGPCLFCCLAQASGTTISYGILSFDRTACALFWTTNAGSVVGPRRFDSTVRASTAPRARVPHHRCRCASRRPPSAMARQKKECNKTINGTLWISAF